MLARALAALLASAAVWPAAAQWRAWDAEFDEDKKPWQEIQARIPAYPRPENLIPFEASGASPHRFFIDAGSLTVGEDGVARYTLVVKTAGGATNVSFEGIRCETREQKYYAAGRTDGNWVRARDPQWRRIEYQEVNRHHYVLYADFFCPGRYIVATAKQALEALRRAAPQVR